MGVANYASHPLSVSLSPLNFLWRLTCSSQLRSMSSRSYCTYCESVFSSVNLVGGLRERGREREREGE